MSSTAFREAWLDGPDGHRFYTRTYPTTPPGAPPKAVVLFLHGFMDHLARYETVHACWARRGVAVFAYDLRGFGRTALDRAHCSPDAAYGRTSRAHELRDLEHWVAHVARAYPGVPLFLFGYSAVSPSSPSCV